MKQPPEPLADAGVEVTPTIETVPAIQTIGIIGAGPAGREFTGACVAAGLDVVLEDVLPARLRQAERELDPERGPGTLRLVTTVEDAVRTAGLVIDFVPDELESKLEVLSMVDRMAPPRTILCTPTEALSISDLATCVYRPELCFAVTGLSEAQVTITCPSWRSAAALAAVEAFFARLRRTVRVRGDERESMLTSRMGS